MAAEIIDGKAIAAAVKADLARRVERLTRLGRTPALGTILVGDDPGSQIYVAGKHRDCFEVGIDSIRVDLDASVTQQQVEEAVTRLNDDPACTGYIVQLPLPAGIDENAILAMVRPDKDADGLAPASMGALVAGTPGALPCTPRAIIEIMRRCGINLDGADVCIVGRGVTVGRPLSIMLSQRHCNATVTLCHSGTRDLADKVRRADIVVAALGKAHFITAEMVRPGAVVVDVGVSRIDGKPVGDVAPSVREVASAITPNPGGVGPMTRAMLLTNIVERAERAAGITPETI